MSSRQGERVLQRRAFRRDHQRAHQSSGSESDGAHLRVRVPRQGVDIARSRASSTSSSSRRQRPQGRQSDSRHRAVDQGRDGFHLWSERYDRELTDVFAIQDEISSAIAAQLKASSNSDSASHKEAHSQGRRLRSNLGGYVSHAPAHGRQPRQGARLPRTCHFPGSGIPAGVRAPCGGTTA